MEAPMSPLIAQLVQEAPVVTDGAWGTQLQARGRPAGEAGGRVLWTNPFRANRLALGASQLAGALGAINRAGVEISQRAAAGRALGVASSGPRGKVVAA